MRTFNIGRLRLINKILVVVGIAAITFGAPFIFNRYGSGIFTKQSIYGILGSLSTTIFMWLGVKSIVIYLWRKFPWQNNPFKHLVLEVLAILLYTSLVGLIFFLLNSLYPIESFDENLKLSIFFTLIITFFITSIYEGYFFFLNWKESRILSEKLLKQNIQSQYETLKSQINPHFLFNNLNTLSALIEENPKVAVEYVRNTADYYRSILGLKDKEVITLREELELIRTFYALQYNRYGNNLSLAIDIPESFLITYVAPLSLQMLVENAIKHNIISIEKPLFIEIFVDNDSIIVRNNLQKRETDQQSSRFGLKNIVDRYSYLSKRKVVIIENDNYFTVSVPILTM